MAGLKDEIDSGRAEIKSDSYPMSIGELISIYERGELDIHPEFQRFFRWTESQKSRLIESMLLGIPIPPIFVSQRPDGIWDVIDGLQRLSTIFQLVGNLKDEAGNLVPPLVLQKTDYLPSLDKLVWEDDADAGRSLPASVQLLIKRARLDINILLKESDPKAKYELFNRLNSGGSRLSEQEVRNCLLIMINPDRYRWLKRLSDEQDFRECIALTDRAEEEQYDVELVLRFVAFRTVEEHELRNIGDLHQFLTERAKQVAENANFDQAADEDAFRFTFGFLKRTLMNESFRKYDHTRRRSIGGFLISAYEAVALGIGYNWLAIRDQEGTFDVTEKVRLLWADADFTGGTGSGIRASSRIPVTIPIGRRHFAP